MKKISVFILAVSILLFASCGNKNYRSDLRCVDLTSEITKASEKEFNEYDESYAKYIVNKDGLYIDHKIIYSPDVNDIDEIGVFKSESEAYANELEQEIKAYIDETKRTQRAFIESYAKNELPKLDNASVYRVGSYVIYIISDTELKSKAISAIENALA